MHLQRTLWLRLSIALVVGLWVSPAAAQAYHGGLDASALIGTRGSLGGRLGGSFGVALCDPAVDCAWSLGGRMEVGATTASLDTDARTWVALAPTLSVHHFGAVAVGLEGVVGVWVGGRDQSLDAGYMLGANTFLGLRVAKDTAFGVLLSAKVYGGDRTLAAFEPGLAFRWRVGETS